MNEIEQFFQRQPEPNRGTFLALRQYILSLDEKMTCEYKYKLPYMYLKGKPFCYFWKDKITQEPYIGVSRAKYIDHPLLEQGDRKLMKIIRINPNEDLPIEELTPIFKNLMRLY